MIPADSEWGTVAPRSRHATAASVACTVSVLMHIALVIAVLKLDVKLPGMMSMVNGVPRLRPLHMRVVDKDLESQVRLQEESETLESETIEETVEKLGLPVSTSLLAPPTATAGDVGHETANLAMPEMPDMPTDWQPRQEIVAIERAVAKTDVPAFDRVSIPALTRVMNVPDLALPVERSLASPPPLQSAGPGRQSLSRRPSAATIKLSVPAQVAVVPQPVAVPSEAIVEEGTELFRETPEEVTPLKPIERVLTVGASTFESRRDRKYGYFKLEIEGIGADVLPVIPKDVILLQDCSASMAEQRLFFCREGLEQCLTALGPEDRFDVIGFRQSTDRCFGKLVDNLPSNIDKAREFIRNIRPGGNTDLLSSLRDLLALPREPGRPIIVLLITDGLATAGQTGSSDIIGEFSQMNDGMVSIYTMGTVQTADRYLLDLLSYSNRGEVMPLGKGRWNIPTTMREAMEKVSRPVLADVRFRFPVGSECEIYPLETGNLYLDRPLVLYGRYPKGVTNVTFQAVGESQAVKCDMLVDVSLAEGAGGGDKALAQKWAEQKVYHLIGEYTRRQDPDVLREIRSTARKYDVDVPHRGRF